jgi:DTW domain-containing protein YfiP
VGNNRAGIDIDTPPPGGIYRRAYKDPAVARDMCYKCWRPKSCCLCPSEPPMRTRTRIVLLMHPKEFRRQKCATGRLTCLNLADSEIVPGVCFEDDARIRELVGDPLNYPVLLYPGKGAVDVRGGGLAPLLPAGRRLTVFLIDATWHCSRKILRLSPILQRLPRLCIHPLSPSRYTIRRQPAAWCLSTIEAAHELLLALEERGLEAYPDKDRLLAVFRDMQDFQIRQISRAASRPGHRVRGTREPL